MNEINLKPAEVLEKLEITISEKTNEIEALRKIKARTAIQLVAEQIQQMIYNGEDTLTALTAQKNEINALISEKETAAAGAANEVIEPEEVESENTEK